MNERSDRLTLAYQILTCGNLTLRNRVLKGKITIERFFELNPGQLHALGGGKELLPAFFDPLSLAEKELATAQKNDIKIVFPTSPSFPSRLLDIYDPPQCLYIKGAENALNGMTLGVIGSRRHSSYGPRVINSFFPDIVSSGLTIVSGMAYGIDALAHHKTFELKGVTVGVNAGGLLHLYPAGNKPLFKEITTNGCIVSEFPLTTVPRPHYFPIRNRIIAGLSRKVWVVEAAEKSGSLITARLAMENGRDVLATPGPVDASTSKGCNRLIRDGAKPVLCVEDILEEYGISIKRRSTRTDQGPSLSTDESLLLDLLKENGVKDIDFLVEKSTLPVNKVVCTLNGLLLKNIVGTESGGFWHINE